MVSTENIESQLTRVKNEIPILFEKLENIEALTSINKCDAIRECLKFLFLVGKSESALSPALIVDLVWHEMILFTRFYASFCDDNFGRFIHHTPDNNRKNNSNNFKKTIRLYLMKYGEPPKEIWGEWAYKEWESAQCGSCKTN